MDPTVVTLRSAADILGVLPLRLGFHPQHSLVVVSLHGPRRRDELVMRFDLPDRRDDQAFCAEVVARLAGAGADATLVVCYSEEALPAHGLLRAPLLRRLRRDLAAGHVELVEALLVRDGRWWSYLCRDASCCPAEGTPLPARPSPAASFYAAESVVRGAVLLPDRASLERSVEPTAADPRLAAEVDQGLLDLLLRRGPGAVERRVVATAVRLALRWEAGDSAPDPREALCVALGIRPKGVRDRVMTLVLDHDPEVLTGLFCELARRTPDADAAAVCAALAWFAYAAGSGALTVVAAERALRVSPGYPMAELILSGLDAMQPPSVIHEISRLVRADLGGTGPLGAAS